METRPKRVMPPRAKTFRGGPGVGNCDVDVMILETYKRRAENEPLIPATTPFLLTTGLSALPKFSEASTFPETLSLNTRANDRYFDRPEVLKAYREQQIIQTPDFANISESPSFSSRFRPRAGDESALDTSDAAYEKRHRKYEIFEKRIRLREKEKLKHEQYKLRERIEQLRNMESTAFLSLPAEALPPQPGQPVQEEEQEEEEGEAHAINGVAQSAEGERRREQMLEIAMSLEERYRTLLPPDRPTYKKATKTSAEELPEPQPTASRSSRRASTALESLADDASERRIMLKIPPRFASVHKYKPAYKKKQEIESPPPPPPPAPPVKKKRGRPRLRPPSPPSPSSSEPLTEIVSNPDIAILSDITPLDSGEDEIDEESEVEPPVPKRQKRRRSSPMESISTVFRYPSPIYASADNVLFNDRSNSSLVIAAIRSSTATVPRKAVRHHMAFGTKAPDIAYSDYELPAWIRDDISLRRHCADSDTGDDDSDDQMQVD